MPLTPATYLITVDSLGSPEPVTIQSNVVRRVTLRQNDQDAVTLYPFLIRVPDATSPAMRYVAGATAVIEANPGRWFFRAGDTIGYIETTTGTAVFTQAEDVQ